MKRAKNRGIGDILSTLTVAVLFAVILLLVVFSAASYQRATASQSANDNSRAVLSYITTAVKGNGKGGVRPADFDGAPGLIIADGDTGYGQRIYLKDGKILQEYGKIDGQTDPEHALVIGEAGKLEISYVDRDVLKVATDLGTSYVSTVR